MSIRYEIERLAYELYERSGYIHGHAEEHWLEAERIIIAQTPDQAQESLTKARKSVPAKAVSTVSAAKVIKSGSKNKTTSGKVTGKTASKARAKKASSSEKEATL